MGAPAAQDLDAQVPRSEAESFKLWFERGRSAMAKGHTLRTTVEADLQAFVPIQKQIAAKAKEYAERQLPPVEVKGAALVVQRLEEGASPGTGAEEVPVEPIAQAAASFVLTRRKAILHVAPGPKGKATRQLFGLHRPVHPSVPSTIVEACNALLKGRRSKKAGVAARLITDADAKKLTEFVVQLKGATRKSAENKSQDASEARDRQALHAGLELFYDRFAAASELVFEENQTKLVAALSLVPRREERRRTRKTPPKTAGQGKGP